MPRAKIKDYYSQERSDAESLIPEGAKRILDVGCGEGMLGKRLLEKGAQEVFGIEIEPQVAERAKENLSGVVCGNLEEIDIPFERAYFDCIILTDILEHLKDPLSALKKFKGYLNDSGVIVASIPNVRYYGVINMLVNGRWEYRDSGILDRGHLRFFTMKEIEYLFNDAGFEITGINTNIDQRYHALKDPFSGEISFGRVSLKDLKPEEIKDLFVFQYLIRAKNGKHELRELDDSVKIAIEAEGPEGAKKVLEGYLELHPANLDVLYKHAEVCHELGQIDMAIESLDRILIFAPDREDVRELRNHVLGKNRWEIWKK